MGSSSIELYPNPTWELPQSLLSTKFDSSDEDDLYSPTSEPPPSRPSIKSFHYYLLDDYDGDLTFDEDDHYSPKSELSQSLLSTKSDNLAGGYLGDLTSTEDYVYRKMKSLQRQLEYFDKQEEIMKHLRAQMIQSVPLAVGPDQDPRWLLRSDSQYY
jgi:hypothetical protein